MDRCVCVSVRIQCLGGNSATITLVRLVKQHDRGISLVAAQCGGLCRTLGGDVESKVSHKYTHTLMSGMSSP